MKIFETIKNDNERRVIVLCEYKECGGFSFVNLTTGKITKCIFKTENDAVKDLENYVKRKLIKSYRIIGEV